MYYTDLINGLGQLIYSIFFSKFCLHNSIGLFRFILYIHVVLLLKHNIRYYKILLYIVINLYFNKNELFVTYFAKTFMIIVVYFFEIHCFMQLHIPSWNFTLHHETFTLLHKRFMKFFVQLFMQLFHANFKVHLTSSTHKFIFIQLFYFLTFFQVKHFISIVNSYYKIEFTYNET